MMRQLLCSTLLTALFLWTVHEITAQSGRPVYTDVTSQAGITFRYTFGDRSYENILESSGSGITIFDYNNDGFYDLYLLNGTWLEGISDEEGKANRHAANELYRNNGDGTFTEVAAETGLDDRYWGMAAGAVDYDNDGDQDLYVLNYGPNVFYRNNGDGTFTDITASTGLAGPGQLNGFTKWSVGVAFADYNRDGLMDAMVGNFLAFDPEYVSPTTPGMMPHPSEYKGQASMMYFQQSGGRFTEVSRELGLYHPDSKCMGLTVYDYDVDGDLDIFQGNDHQLNFLFRNDGERFTDVAIAAGVAANSRGLPTGSMHGSIGDVDGDGLIDMLVVDLRYGALYRHTGRGIYEDITERSGVEATLAGKGAWAAELFDYDNDGDLDLFSANGTAEELILQLPVLMENNGQGRFTDIGPVVSDYFAVRRSGRGAAVWDYDNDGDMDIIISHVDLQATATLLRNDGGNRGNWMGLLLEGKNGPASAIGARVTVYSGSGRQVHINQWATSYLSSHDPRMHIGLDGQRAVDRVEVVWSDATKEVFYDLPVNQYITLKEGDGSH